VFTLRLSRRWWAGYGSVVALDAEAAAGALDVLHRRLGHVGGQHGHSKSSLRFDHDASSSLPRRPCCSRVTRCLTAVTAS
jgi:hypothetical protein